MMPILQVGPLAVQLPGLVLLVGLWLGLTLSEKYASNYKIESDKIYNLVLIALVSGVIGARLAYVARYPIAFSHSPLSLISLNPGLLDTSGGLLTAAIAAIVYLQRAHMNFWTTLDALVPMLACVNIAVAGANLASGNGFGAPSDLPWSIQLFGELRHPTQVYEMVLAGLILLGMLPEFGPVEKWVARLHTPGNQFIVFIILAATSRLFTETFHGDSILIAYGLRRVQIGAWITLAVGLTLFANRTQHQPNELENDSKP